MESRCDACGARLYGEASWCGQCLAPVREGFARPSFPTHARAGAAPLAEAAPAASRASAPLPPALPPAGVATLDARRDHRHLAGFASPPADAPLVPLVPPAPSAYAPPAPPPPASVPRLESGVFTTTAGVICLGVVLQLALLAVAKAAQWDMSEAIRIGLWANLGYYAVVAALVVRQAQRVAFRPVWTEGDPTNSLIRGLVMGGSIAAVLVALTSLAEGQLSTDPRLQALLSERTFSRTAFAIVIACVAAPWVEELLFRGLALEALKPWGTRAAVLGSAAAFSLWHTDSVLAGWELHLRPFLYYVAMGATFARLYLRSGLKATIAAHTAFNGVLVFVALVVVTGPAHVVEANGVSATVPASWHMAEGDLPPGTDLAVEGPSGAGLLVAHVTLPPGIAIDLETQAGDIAQGMATTGTVVDLATVHPADYPMGRVLRMSAKVDGQDARLVLTQHDGAIWTTVLMSGGSDRAEKDFEAILGTLKLPPAGANP